MTWSYESISAMIFHKIWKFLHAFNNRFDTHASQNVQKIPKVQSCRNRYRLTALESFGAVNEQSIRGLLRTSDERVDNLYKQFCFEGCQNYFSEVVNFCILCKKFLLAVGSNKKHRALCKIGVPCEFIKRLQCDICLLMCTYHQKVWFGPCFKSKFYAFRSLRRKNTETFFSKKSTEFFQGCVVGLKDQNCCGFFF